MPPARPPPQRERYLDFLRAAAILVVVFGLAMLAGYGMSLPQFPYLRVVPLAMALGGVALIVSRGSPRPAPRAPR